MRKVVKGKSWIIARYADVNKMGALDDCKEKESEEI